MIFLILTIKQTFDGGLMLILILTSVPTSAVSSTAILFAVSVFGPALGYLLGSVVLRIYVDADKIGFGNDQPDPDADENLFLVVRSELSAVGVSDRGGAGAAAGRPPLGGGLVGGASRHLLLPPPHLHPLLLLPSLHAVGGQGESR